MCNFRSQNGPFVLNKNFLVQTIIITFIYLLTLFTVQNFTKFLQQIQSYEDVPFWGPKRSTCPKQILFWKIIQIILIYLLAPFIVQNFKKILPADPARVMMMCNFWAQNGPFPQIIFSKNLLMRLVSFVHAYLPAQNQSQILIY